MYVEEVCKQTRQHDRKLEPRMTYEDKRTYCIAPKSSWRN